MMWKKPVLKAYWLQLKSQITKQFAYLLTCILEILIYQSQLYCCSVCQTEKNRMLRNFRQKRPNQNSEGREFDSHLEIRNYSEFSGVWILLLL